MKLWITKYALTTGIQEVDGHVVEAHNYMVEVPPQGESRYCQYFHGEGRDWHRTKESAIARANKLRDKKIARLTLQLKKLKQMEFN